MEAPLDVMEVCLLRLGSATVDSDPWLKRKREVSDYK